MRIGIDFDNTIICYDAVFNSVGVEKGLIPGDLPTGKTYVKGYLINKGLEERWTWLQGHVYGKRLNLARPYDNFTGFLTLCNARSIDCVIISHKTVYPYSGEKHNLHDAARFWIDTQGFGLPVFFEETRENKIRRINEQGCTLFIDDLPSFLSLPGFDPGVTKLLFDPSKNSAHLKDKFHYAASWDEIISMCREKDFFQ